MASNYNLIDMYIEIGPYSLKLNELHGTAESTEAE